MIRIVCCLSLLCSLAGCAQPRPTSTEHYPITVMLDPVTEVTPNVLTNRAQ